MGFLQRQAPATPAAAVPRSQPGGAGAAHASTAHAPSCDSPALHNPGPSLTAGPTGIITAIYLAKHGHKVHVFPSAGGPGTSGHAGESSGSGGSVADSYADRKFLGLLQARGAKAALQVRVEVWVLNGWVWLGVRVGKWCVLDWFLAGAAAAALVCVSLRHPLTTHLPAGSVFKKF